MREWKYRHHVVGVVNAGVDLSARYGNGGGDNTGSKANVKLKM